ncbi:hypothetical protein [Paenibacillus harenae]|uniref:hypothetical protein n=1 Tax=Paenibacillus harenae TaxID=306543 RepID=UPI0027903D03|nr:hypothetical protein [Paenibacillus harenae]MDQ0062880.1 putative membrane protein [Paenibacillus harenae]
MVLGAYLVATLIIVLVFAYLPKRLHLLELWFNAIVHVYFYTYQFSVLTNLKLVSLPESPDKAAASVAVRFIIFPVIVLLYLQLYDKWKQRSRTAGFAAFVVTGALLLLAQPLFQWTGIIRYSNNGIYWSALAWIVLLGINSGCMTAFRRLVRKELLLP